MIPGYTTPMWAYNGSVPGPTFKASRGRGAVIRHLNTLPAKHPDPRLHTVDLGAPARLGVTPAVRRVRQRHHEPRSVEGLPLPELADARTLWYHDHGLHHTAENVYMGLAGQYQILDELEYVLPIPTGEFDVPLIVADGMFPADGGCCSTTTTSRACTAT